MSFITEVEARKLFRVTACGVATTLLALGIACRAGDRQLGEGEAPQTGPADRGAENAEAFDLYLQARDLLMAGNAEAIASAVERLNEALAIDPDFARARAKLGVAYLLYSDTHHDRSDAYALAERAAREALAIDASSADARAVEAFLLVAKREWKHAGESFERALALAPDEPLSRIWYGEYLFALGRFEEALSQSEAAQRLYAPAEWPPRQAAELGFYHYAMGAEERGLEILNQLIEQSIGGGGEAGGAYRFRAAHHQRTGDYDAMFKDQLIDFRASGAPEDLVAWARRRVAGLYNPKLTAAVVKKIDAEYRAGGVQDPAVGLYAADLGAYDLAARMLEDLLAKSFEASRAITATMMWLWHPRFEAFRRDPAFRRLLIGLGVVDYWRESRWGDPCRPLGERDFECS